MQTKRHSLLLLVFTFFCLPGLLYAGVYNATDVAMSPGKNISEMNFNWYSPSGTNSLVQVALKSDMQGQVFPAVLSTSFYCITAHAAQGHYSNKAVANALPPSSEFVYRLGDGNGNWTSNYFFNTYQEEEFGFIAVGDPQIGAGRVSSDTAAWQNTLNQALTLFPRTAFIMSAGDQVNTTYDENQFSGFFSPPELRNIPVAPALGNHDNGANNTGYHFNLPNLSDYYGVTSPGSANYYYTYGNTLFIVLNTNNFSGSSHEVFISNAVAANPDVTWKIVMFHHDIYGSAYHSLQSSVQNLRAALFPVFDMHGIDIVINGHDHSYTRTHVMRGDIPRLNQDYDQYGSVINPDGTVYFTLNTASGSKYYSLNTSRAGYVAERSQLNVPTFSYITIDENRLTFNTYRIDSPAMTDTFSILKNSTSGSGSGQILERRISNGVDDVEERESNGRISLNSSDLELVYDSRAGNQVIGLRFNSIDIPGDAVITAAYIQFTCNSPGTGNTDLSIRGQAADNAQGFSTTSYNVSSRTVTSRQVDWSPPAWTSPGETGPGCRTPEIKSIIQEIIDRAGWTGGNSIAIIIRGDDSGTRNAESFNGSSTGAPLLHIKYQ